VNKKRIPPISKAATAAIPVDSKAFKKLKISLGIIIAVFAFLLYVQSVAYNYTLDDHPVIDENTITTKGFAGIPTLIKTDYWYGCIGKGGGPIYRPTSVIMFAVVWQLFGNAPHIYHFMNVLLYAITCLVLFLLLCKLFEKDNQVTTYGLLFSFVCSLLYTAHPLHTEVVNNIKSADEILCFLFGILAMYFVVKSVSDKFILNLVLSGICFFLALISKESGTSLLLIIPLTLFVFTAIPLKKLGIISSAFLGITLVYFIIRYEVLKSVPQANTISYLANSLLTAPDFISRETTAFFIQLKYFYLLIVPYALTCDYNFSMIKIHSITDPLALLGLTVCLGIGIYAFLNISKKSIVAFGILFYLIMLAPVSNIFILIGATMAERFLYTPSLGFCLVLTFYLIKLTNSESIKSGFNNLSQFLSLPSKLFIVVSLILVLYSIRTISRNFVWVDNYTAFNHDVEISDNSTTAHYALGGELLDIYSDPKEKDLNKKSSSLDRAIKEFTKSIAIAPKESGAYFMLGKCYLYKLDYANALEFMKKCIQLEKYSDTSDIKTLAATYYDFALQYNQSGGFDKSIPLFDSAIKYYPNFSSAFNNKGVAYLELGKYKEAIEACEKAIELDPKNHAAYTNIGCAYTNSKQYEQALEYLKKSISLDSTDNYPVYIMGITYQQMGDAEKSKLYLEKSVNIQKKYHQ